MKAVLIVYNQALTDVMMDILDKQSLRGFTQWDITKGRGSENGEPHYGNHTWPSKNIATLVITEEKRVEPLLTKLRELNSQTEEQGTRAFVWSIEGGM